ncbi:hypothetical protein RCO48_00080 [Peribacillus frigoritolerans]|nr:hypothetical protein [Peribacillus frigoritolerans]
MNYAYATFKKEKVLPANYQVKGKETLSVVKGKEKDVKIQSEKAIELLVENGGKDNYKTDLVIDKNKLNDDGKLTAPIKKGEKLGYITVTPKKGEDYGYINGDPVKVNVVAAESVEKANWFVLSMRAVGGFFGDVWSSVASTVKGWF